MKCPSLTLATVQVDVVIYGANSIVFDFVLSHNHDLRCPRETSSDCKNFIFH